MAKQTEAEAETVEENDDGFEYHPQITQHATSIIEGDVTDIVTGADIDSGVEQTGTSFGIIIENPEVVGDGTLWRNRNIPDNFDTISEFNDTLRMALADDSNTTYVRGTEATDDNIEAAQARLDEAGVEYEDGEYDDLKVSGTDYKIADVSDSRTEKQEIDGNVLGIDVGGGTFPAEEVDDFDTDTIMVWYGGMAGQFAGRALDANGQPFARFTDEGGYLVKGLLQAPVGWRGEADIEQYGDVETTDRSKLATDLNRAPRVARPPILRDDIDGRVFIALGRYNGGRMNEVHVGRAMDDYTDFLSQLRDNEEPEYDAYDMRYDEDIDERLVDAFENPAEAYSLYTGEGWLDEPADATYVGGDDTDEDTSGGSFDVSVDEDVDHPTDEEVEFGQMVAAKLNDADGELTPDAAFDGGLGGMVEANADNFSNETDVSAIRDVVYENTDHL